MVNVENLYKSFGGQFLFEGINFKINPRERVGLVGQNGHGKTTLFRLIVDEELPDDGSITFPRHYRIGYVRQHLEFSEDTVLKEGMKGLPEGERNHYWKVEKILAGLGFSQEEMNRHPEEFSGGYQVRLNLVKILVSEPDLLLLDEPTNYLDITSIRWIEQFLINWPHELMLITHDRSLMDKIVTHILGIHHRKIRKISGNTEKFYAQIAYEEEIYEKTRINSEKRRKEIELFINRFRAKARLANLVQSRIKTLDKMGKREKLERIPCLEFSFRNIPFPGKQILNTKNLSFSYNPEKPLIKNLDINIMAGDRVCIIGKNGKGKTTLLRLLAKELAPQNGKITCHPGLVKGFFEQTNLKSLVETRTVEEEILYSFPDVNRQLARNICGAMMFQGDDALKKIEVLSGGEKSRVMLGKLLATPVNLLLLDEPTNHLDMESCDALLAAIDSFEGTIIMVTHNEMFLNALAKRIIVFQNDQVYMFEGSYQDFLEKNGWENENLISSPGDLSEQIKSAQKESGEKKASIKLSKKEARRRRSEINTERAKVLTPLEQHILKIENNIELHEKKLNELNEDMVTASQAKQGARIARLSKSVHDHQSSIASLYDELEDITGAFEEQKAIFKNRIDKLEHS